MADRITEIFERHRSEFRFRTPFGVLLEDDMRYLVKATARDAGVTVAEVLQEVAHG
jgi:hypothetical protein